MLDVQRNLDAIDRVETEMFGVIDNLKAGAMKPKVAEGIVKAGHTIVQGVKMRVAIAVFATEAPNAIGDLSAAKAKTLALAQ